MRDFDSYIFLMCAVILCPALVLGCGRGGSRYRDRTAPTLSCPGDRTEIADEMQVNTQVNWTEPTGVDEKDGHIIPSRTGPGPGKLFSEGNTKITYSARDRSGNVRSCSFQITVTVTRCKEFDDITDGWKICHPSHDMRRGGTCRFGCYDGHELQGSSSVTCLDSGLWTAEIQPICKKRTCPADFPADLQTHIDCSNDNYYRSICTFSCDPGYDILPGFSRVKVCAANGDWNGLTPLCIDNKPPEFENCPSIKTAYADKSRTTGRVWWDDPIVKDNSGTVHLIQTAGPTSGDELGIGEHVVTYIARDDVNNTAECSFKVIVKQIFCPKIYTLPYTSVVCPSGRIYGSSCVFSCDNNTAINGQSETQCEKVGAVHYYGQWTFGDYQPYCTLTSICPDLLVPNDGALACDVWMDGRFCQLFCRKGYLFNSQKGYDLQRSLLVCGDSGKWYPEVEALPDCVRETRLTSAVFKLEAVFYFDGTCESALDEIKQNFLARFAAARGCEDPDKCIVENVEVTCGINTEDKRKKRDAGEEVVISADIKIKPSSEDVVKELLDQRQNIKNALKSEQVGNSNLVFKSEKVSAPKMQCPDGYEPNNQEYKCAECSKGHFHDKTSKDCVQCPYGQYQPDSRQTSCVECPYGTTTIKKGSVDESQCLDACEPGYFSVTGIKPCSPCDIGYYSAEYGSREGTECPGTQITQLGANHINSCYDFDLEFKENVTEPATLHVPASNTLEKFVVELWIQCTTCHNVLTVSDSGIVMVLLTEYDNFSIAVKGHEYSTDKKLSTTPLWKFIRITVSPSSLRVTVNGQEVLHEVLIGPQQQHDYTELNITVGGAEFRGSISNFNIRNDTNIDNKTESQKCASDKPGNIVSWKQFAELDGDFVIVHSSCDDFDNCLSEPCQNGGSCKDELSNYTCSCSTGYTGPSCETNIDDCLYHACENGASCEDGVAGYNCLCEDGFKGPLCEIKVVDGAWSEWEDWGPCSVTCGNGTWTRLRTCSNPTPDNGGKQCEGDSMETAECFTDEECLKDCSEDPKLANGDTNCTWSGTTRVCKPFCNTGFDFDTDMYLDVVMCGLDTGFTWNINTEDNPTGQLPSCIKITTAETNTMYYKGVYPDLDIANVDDKTAEAIKTSVDANVAQTPCVQHDRCKHIKTEVVADNSREDDRNKSEVQSASVIVYISCDLVTDTDECFRLLKEVKEILDEFVQQLAFSVNVASITYNVDVNSISIDGVSTCDAGTAPVFYYCVPCGEGTYQLEDYCERCPRGTYQDEVGQTSCKNCPEGWSTIGLMSRDQSLCNVPVDVPSASIAIWMVVLAAALPVILCGTIVICVVSRCKRYHRRQTDASKGGAGQENLHNNIPQTQQTAEISGQEEISDRRNHRRQREASQGDAGQEDLHNNIQQKQLNSETPGFAKRYHRQQRDADQVDLHNNTPRKQLNADICGFDKRRLICVHQTSTDGRTYPRLYYSDQVCLYSGPGRPTANNYS